MAKKKGDFQPTKYDWVALEAEFLAGDEPSVSKFFRDRKIPTKTYQTQAKGWGQKRQSLLQKGLQIFKNKVAKEIADQAEIRLTLSKGIIKTGSDALFPPKEGQTALRPTTAREAAQLIQIGHNMAKSIADDMQEAVRVEISSTEKPQTEGQGDTPKVVTVSIKLPDNHRDKVDE